jgi:hypothetical protein
VPVRLRRRDTPAGVPPGEVDLAIRVADCSISAMLFKGLVWRRDEALSWLIYAAELLYITPESSARAAVMTIDGEHLYLFGLLVCYDAKRDTGILYRWQGRRRSHILVMTGLRTMGARMGNFQGSPDVQEIVRKPGDADAYASLNFQEV